MGDSLVSADAAVVAVAPDVSWGQLCIMLHNAVAVRISSRSLQLQAASVVATQSEATSQLVQLGCFLMIEIVCVGFVDHVAVNVCTVSL